jgi:hypothetical protein
MRCSGRAAAGRQAQVVLACKHAEVEDVDEGVLQVALLAVEFGDAQMVFDHAGKHIGGDS